MKDNRFIELVNLYIDRQITAAETAELEAEMQASPRRRAVYRQYCQMHRATKSVYESFRGHATEPQASQAAGQGVIANFESQRRHRRFRWTYYAGGLAAAACLTLALVRFNTLAPRVAPARTITKVETLPTAEVVMAAAPVRAREDGPASLNKLITAEPNYAELLTAMRQEEKRAFANGQIQPNPVPSLFDDGVFDSRQLQPANSSRVFRGKQAPAPQAEFTAFEFRH